MLSSHSRQSGHHDPVCSLALLSHSESVSSSVLSLVQYWYLPSDGGLTTPEMCQDPASTNFTGPPKNCEPYSTDSARAIWSSVVTRLYIGTLTLERSSSVFSSTLLPVDRWFSR